MIISGSEITAPGWLAKFYNSSYRFPQQAPHPHSDILTGMIRAVLTNINEMIDNAWLSCQIMESIGLKERRATVFR